MTLLSLQAPTFAVAVTTDTPSGKIDQAPVALQFRRAPQRTYVVVSGISRGGSKDCDMDLKKEIKPESELFCADDGHPAELSE